jgi:hypothetical protein
MRIDTSKPRESLEEYRLKKKTENSLSDGNERGKRTVLCVGAYFLSFQ